MLEVKDVTKTFGSITALRDLNVKVDKGEFVFLTGVSGSGKTTFLRLILREILPDSGEIILDEENIVDLKQKNVPKLRQKIGVVFQDFKVLPERTTRENIEVALAVSGVSQKEWKERVNHVLALVGLTGRSRLFPSQLSGGELQRVSLARALVVNPKMILADEPTGNLDWETAEELMKLFEKINEEGKTILMATHHRGIIDKFKKREIKLEKHKDKLSKKIPVEKKEDEPKIKSESKPKEGKEEKKKETKDKEESKLDKKMKKSKNEEVSLEDNKEGKK